MICKSEFEVLKFDIKHNIKFILKLNLFKGDFSFNYMFCINAINTLTLLENCNVRSQVPKRTKERREEGGEGGGRGKWRWDKWKTQISTVPSFISVIDDWPFLCSPWQNHVKPSRILHPPLFPPQISDGDWFLMCGKLAHKKPLCIHFGYQLFIVCPSYFPVTFSGQR